MLIRDYINGHRVVQWIRRIYLEVDIESRYKTNSNEKTCIELLNNFTIVERIQLGSNEVHTILKHV